MVANRVSPVIGLASVGIGPLNASAIKTRRTPIADPAPEIDMAEWASGAIATASIRPAITDVFTDLLISTSGPERNQSKHTN
jgi:hypothetical protein